MMETTKVQRSAGCYLMPSWDQAKFESGGGFDDSIHAQISLTDYFKHVTPPPHQPIG